MELKLSRRWGKERGMFRDNHFDNGYAAHRLFTEMFGDSTLKPNRLSTSGIFQAYSTTPLEEVETHACRANSSSRSTSATISANNAARALRSDQSIAASPLVLEPRYFSYPWASAHSPTVIFATAARARYSLTMPSASRL